ncbi:unnamed protein product [Pylaiella littoralis]
MGCTARAAAFLFFLAHRPVSSFLPPATHPGAGIATTLSGSTYQQRHAHTVLVRPRDALVVMAEVDADMDIPGIADARLAGWRAAGKAASSDGTTTADTSPAPEGNDDESGEPGCGDVVEYPLSDLVKKESDDDRQRGVAVIVSINKLRNDAWKLPEDILDKAELQVLCPDLDSDEEGVWMADELENCAFARLGEMKVLKSSFNGAMDKWKRWTISDELSEGCGARDSEWDYDML